jgi:tetratricopeptide (TPR) repeat protein
VLKSYMGIILICFILISCSNIEKGKSALKEGNYTEAITLLEQAEIDEPNNKDVEKLLEIAKEKRNEELIKENLPSYLEKIEPFIIELKSIYSSLDIKNLDEEEINAARNKFQSNRNTIGGIKLHGEFGIYGDPNLILPFVIEGFEGLLNSATVYIKHKNKISEIKKKKEIDYSTEDYLKLTDPNPKINFQAANLTFQKQLSEFEAVISELKSKYK